MSLIHQWSVCLKMYRTFVLTSFLLTTQSMGFARGKVKWCLRFKNPAWIFILVPDIRQFQALKQQSLRGPLVAELDNIIVGEVVTSLDLLLYSFRLDVVTGLWWCWRGQSSDESIWQGWTKQWTPGFLEKSQTAVSKDLLGIPLNFLSWSFRAMRNDIDEEQNESESIKDNINWVKYLLTRHT